MNCQEFQEKLNRLATSDIENNIEESFTFQNDLQLHKDNCQDCKKHWDAFQILNRSILTIRAEVPEFSDGTGLTDSIMNEISAPVNMQKNYKLIVYLRPALIAASILFVCMLVFEEWRFTNSISKLEQKMASNQIQNASVQNYITKLKKEKLSSKTRVYIHNNYHANILAGKSKLLSKPINGGH